ncbi:uncharacterized protein LOC144638230 [Oculina patagonica]
MPRSLTAFTVCLWMSSSNTQGTLLSYAISGQDNELIIEYNRYFDFLIGGTQRTTLVAANDGEWHHVCVSWENSAGSWKFYKDGDLTNEGTSLKRGHTIRQGGTMVLGQEQDEVGGGFQTSQSFQGKLSNVNVWNSVINAAKIKEMSASCLLNEADYGNVFKWLDFLRDGEARLIEPSSCQAFGKDYTFNFPDKGVTDVVKISGMNSLTAFTVCLWMSSTSTQGTLLSYAVSGQDNELIIEYNRYFDFLIGGTQRVTSVTANDGVWHHICVSWENGSGSWKFYKDCLLSDQGTSFKRGHTIRQGGTLVLGQEQDSVGGDFESVQSFQGMLSNVNVWNNVLSAAQITEMSTSCQLDEWNAANVYKWTTFLRQGGAKLLKPSPCEPYQIMDHAFNFPNKGVTDVVKITNMPRSLTAFTICLWMSSSNSQGTLVSYAISGQDNELIIEYNRLFDFLIGGTQRTTSVTANDGAWHHICLSWEKVSGSWKFYKDGFLKKNGNNFKKGHTIRQGGTLVLGQEQDSVGGGFQSVQSFQGMLSNVNIWDRVLSAAQIKEISASCVLDEWNEANVYKWSDFLHQGGTMLLKPSPCKPFGTSDYSFQFPDKGVTDVVKIANMPRSLTAFTACLWMSSSNSQGTLLSYAVSDQDNEFLIEYNGSFDMLIGGTQSDISATANDGLWHYICVSWASNSGAWKFYKDGDLSAEGSNFKKDYTIRKGGTLVLGQEQDSVGGGFQASQSFQGMLSNLNLWDRLLPTSQIKKISSSCVLDEWNEGNVYKWSDFLHQGGTTLLKPSPCTPSGMSDYAFHFPDKGVTDVVKIANMPRSLTAFTVCLWMSSGSSRGTLLSYAVSGQDNELIIEYNGSFDMLINGQQSDISVTANDGAWHHICVSWASNSGSWKFYKDGDLKDQGTLKRSYTIKQGGTLVLGQEQDSVGGGFQTVQSFQGMFSLVNVWESVLSASKINEMSKSCQLSERNEGTLYKWFDFLYEGGARLVHPSPCKMVEVDYAFHFPDKGVNDAVKISGMPGLEDFTVCLWMKSSNTQGTLVSYAVSGQDNELIIEYNKYFDFLIGGTERKTSVTAFDSVWHHICLSRQRSSGAWKFYKDGYLIEQGTNFKRGHTIQQGGTLVLGQEQDSVGGGFQAIQSFQGMLSNVNVWNRVLTGTLIEEMATTCPLDGENEGIVYKWLDFIRQGGAGFVQPSPCEPLGKDYAFHFPDKGVTDVVKITNMPRDLTAFTACLWMSSSNAQGTLLSYALSGQDNELIIEYNRYFDMLIGGTQRISSVTANDGVWHHICVSWQSNSGSWKLYKDGDLKDDGTNFKKDHTIIQGGTLVLGQEQDSVGGGFQSVQSFQGMLSGVNVWDQALTAEKIMAMSKSCLVDKQNEGSVYKWFDFLLHGGAMLVKPSPCEPFTSLDYAFHFPEKRVTDVVKMSDMARRLTAFTVCLWMNSGNSQGTLLSYAVSGQDNELIIEYDGNFDMLIGGEQRVTSVAANDGVWHHICVSWEKDSGSWKFYKDGDLKEEGTSFKKGHTITQGGTLVLGQEQDSVGGGFQSVQSLQGMLSNVNVWDRVVSGRQVQEMSKSCESNDRHEGNVYKWVDFLREGGPSLTQSPTCKAIEAAPGGEKLPSAGDWTYWKGHYYYYREKSAANSWFAAEGVCRDYGETVHLTSIHSQQENDFIKSLSSGDEEQWIGLTDHNIRTNSFKWMDRSPYGAFTNWAKGEPNQASVDEDCGAMKPDGKWIDVACRKQRVGSDTPFDRRAFTCKTSGNTVTYGPPPSTPKQVKETHEPAISVVDLSSGGQSTKISFFTALHHIAPNTKFSSTADKVQKGALLKFGGYVHMTSEQLGPSSSQRRRDAMLKKSGAVKDQDNSLIGVADLDGIVDKIEIPHYSDMSTMGSTSSTGFSIEFWIRPRRMPVDTTPMALFFKTSPSTGSISLNLNLDGSLTFSVTPRSGTPLTCTTDVSDETHKVRALVFQHIAVTGTVGSSLMIKVKGETACQKNTWGGITVLAASNEGTLVFGENHVDTRQPIRFNGQIRNIQLFSTVRTNEQIARSIKQPDPAATGSIGFWSLQQSDKINVIQYVISNSQSVSNLEVLEDYDPPLTGFPVEAVVRGQKIYIIRGTGDGHVVAKKFTLSADKRTITPLPGNQRIITSSQSKKGCLAAAIDDGRDRLMVMECFAEEQSPGALRIKWNVFDVNQQDRITATTQTGSTGSLLVKDIGSLDTRLSAKIVNNHLLLTAGTTSSASILFLDVTLNSNGLPSISVNELAAQTVGPEVVNNGATYYAYLKKETDSSLKPFLRRRRPENGAVSSSFIIEERDTNPRSLVATNPIRSNMPDDDWFWFLFKISTMNSGVAIQSGERINIQTPDNNPQNENGWSYVKFSCKTLQADQRAEQLNFWIFKTKSCDPKNGGYSVVSGEIGPDACILLWPKTEQFEPGQYQHILALPTDREIESAKVRFGSWFGPWRLVIPMEPSPVRPIPVPTGSSSNSPRNVYQGNKYSLLHFGEGISLAAPSQQAGVRGGLLQFAKTTVAPIIISNNGNPALIKLIFRGNGGSFPLVAFPHDQKAKLEVLFSTVYQEGSYAQRRMTSGLFYSIAYTPPSDSSSSGEFKNLARIGGLETLEYPNPPNSFIWLIPPPFKVTGMCAAISTLFQFNDDKVKNIAPNSVASLTEVVTNVVGPGSFGEGLFKPFLSVHFDVSIVNKIGEQIHESLMRKINERIPDPPPASPTIRPPLDTHSWQELADLEACVSLSNTSFWEDKVQIQKIKDKLTQALRSKWMNNELYKIREQVAPNFLREASARYSAYGGIAVLIATRLRSKEFLEELLTKDKSYIQPILDSHLKILDFIRPDLGIAVREDIMSALTAKEITSKPWSILESLDEEKQREALSAAITSIYEGPNVPEQVKVTFEESMKELLNAILYPITSTQLGVYSNFLDMRKLDVLSRVDERARNFKTDFLDIFVQNNLDDIKDINIAKRLHRSRGRILNYLGKQRILNQEAWARNWKEYYRINRMTEKIYRIKDNFREQLKTADPALLAQSNDYLSRKIRSSPRFVAGLSHTFNVLGTAGAMYSVIKELSDANSDTRQGNPRAILTVVATSIGGIGSVYGTISATIDLMKILKEKFFAPPKPTTRFYGFRSSDEFFTIEQELATEVSVDVTNMERASSRLARMAESRTIGRVFTAFGVVADGIFFGISVYDLYKDFTADTRDNWKIADDFLFAASAGIGAALGIATFVGVAGAAAAATGIGALIVIGLGLIALISDAIRQRQRAKQERKRQCDKWKQWCSWGKGIFHHYGFLKDSDADPCSNCPTKKHYILRVIRSNPGLFPSALKRALINGLDSGKDVKSLVPSLGKIEKKTCPAWLRHVFKRQGKRR